MSDFIFTHPAAGEAIQTLVARSSELPEFTRAHVLAASGLPSNVDRSVQTVEALYAANAEIPDFARMIGAQLARFLANEGFHGMDQGRGPAIAAAFLRAGGIAAPEGQAWPSAEDDPQPVAAFVAPAEPLADEAAD